MAMLQQLLEQQSANMLFPTGRCHYPHILIAVPSNPSKRRGGSGCSGLRTAASLAGYWRGRYGRKAKNGQADFFACERNSITLPSCCSGAHLRGFRAFSGM
jgi:hypothetical protein